MSQSFSEVAQAALAALRQVPGVDFADVRVSADERDELALEDGRLQGSARDRSAGVGVRVLRDGAWGFSAQPGPTEESAVAAAREAAEIAAGCARVAKERVRLCEEEPQVGRYATPIERDPFAVPLEQRIADLRAATDAAHEVGGDLSAHASMRWWRSTKAYASTEGSRLEQVLVCGGAGLKVIARADGEAQQRTWPMDFDGGLAAAGYETVAALELADNARRCADEARQLLTAPLCPAGTITLVLDTPQLALQIHESCGHPTESDRALGDEVSLAGASFLTPDRLGRFVYGAPIVNLVADARSPGGLGTFGWDDEGVPARKTPLVSRGVFVGYLSSRETAATLGLGRSAGCLRSESWAMMPIIRMINVSLEPDPDGPSSLGELIADTDDGLLMTQNLSWSIDDLRLNFQFGCEAAWEIRGGKRGRLYRNPLYTGSTPSFWRGCDAIGNQDAWRLWGFSSCGKGDPVQSMTVGHGCAPARFRNVEVGASR